MGHGYSGILRVMAFVDGGYLEHNLNDLFKSPKIDYSVFIHSLVSHLPKTTIEHYLTRVYYYDAISAEKVSPDQQAKHELIHGTNHFELRLGRIKDDGQGMPRQKGVDTLIAIDMVSKAYENHYDVAILLAGDDDFLDAVKAVKNAGKQVYGFFFAKHVSRELKNAFDSRLAIDTNFATQIRHPKKAL
jgi:uncharacterized LabA/DUF88 family protein